MVDFANEGSLTETGVSKVLVSLARPQALHVKLVMLLADTNRTGKVWFPSFEKAVNVLLPNGTFQTVLDDCDYDWDGQVNSTELTTALRLMGANVAEPEVAVFLKSIDTNKDGLVPRKLFVLDGMDDMWYDEGIIPPRPMEVRVGSLESPASQLSNLPSAPRYPVPPFVPSNILGDFVGDTETMNYPKLQSLQLQPPQVTDDFHPSNPDSRDPEFVPSVLDVSTNSLRQQPVDPALMEKGALEIVIAETPPVSVPQLEAMSAAQYTNLAAAYARLDQSPEQEHDQTGLTTFEEPQGLSRAN